VSLRGLFFVEEDSARVGCDGEFGAVVAVRA
jgi:hypothetical protein